MDMIIANIFVFAAIVGGLSLLGLAAEGWGVDSRPSIGDTHSR
jgi:hypothetical protein